MAPSGRRGDFSVPISKSTAAPVHSIRVSDPHTLSRLPETCQGLRKRGPDRITCGTSAFNRLPDRESTSGLYRGSGNDCKKVHTTDLDLLTGYCYDANVACW